MRAETLSIAADGWRSHTRNGLPVAAFGALAGVATPPPLSIDALGVLGLICAPVIVSAAWRRPKYRIFLLSALCWATAQIVSDGVNGALGLSTVYEIATISLLVLLATTMLWLARDSILRWGDLIVGIGAGLLIKGLILSRGLPLPDLWKFHIAEPFCLIVVCLAARRRGRWIPPIACVLLSILNLGLGFRSLSAICVATAAILTSMALQPRTSDWKRLLLLLVVTIAALVGLRTLYGAAAEHGLLGQAEQFKYAYQSQTQTSLLTTARPQFLAGVLAVKEAPIVGLGSNPQLSARSQSELFAVLSNDRVTINDYLLIRTAGQQLQAHSYLLDTWVRGGIFALASLFWVGATGFIWLRRGQPVSPLTSVVVFLIALFAWDVVFSPNGPTFRVLLASLIALLCSPVIWKHPNLDVLPAITPQPRRSLNA